MQNCFHCDFDKGTVFCKDCDYLLCLNCNKSNHFIGDQKNKYLHSFFEICEECDEQEREIYCKGCEEYFCKPCFNNMHRRGNRKYHIKEELNTTKRYSLFCNILILCEVNKNVIDSLLNKTTRLGLYFGYSIVFIKKQDKQLDQGLIDSIKDFHLFDDLEDLIVSVREVNQHISEKARIDSFYLINTHIALEKEIEREWPHIRVFKEIIKNKDFDINKDVYHKKTDLSKLKGSGKKLNTNISETRLSRLILDWENSFLVKNKLKHPVEHIYNDIDYEGQEGKRYLKIIQKELHKQALEGQLKILREKLLKSLQAKYDLSLIKLQHYIDKAAEFNIIYQQHREFSANHSIVFISLKNSFLFSHENFLWIVRSLVKDEISLSEEMILNRIKDVFDLDSSEFLHDYFDDYIKFKLVTNEEKVILFKDLCIVKRKNTYKIIFFQNKKKECLCRSCDKNKSLAKQTTEKIKKIRRSNSFEMSMNKCALENEKDEVRECLNRVEYVSYDLNKDYSEDKDYTLFSNFVQRVFDEELLPIGALLSKNKDYSFPNDFTIEKSNSQLNDSMLQTKLGRVQDIEAILPRLRKISRQNRYFSTDTKKFNRNVSGFGNFPINKNLWFNNSVNQTSSNNQFDMISGEKEYSLPIAKNGIPGGRYGLALFIKYFGTEQLREFSLGKILSLINFALKIGELRHIKTFIILGEKTEFFNTSNIDMTKNKKEMIDKLETVLIKIFKENGNVIRITKLHSVLEKEGSVKFKDFAPYGIIRWKDLLTELNPNLFTIEKLKKNDFALVYKKATEQQREYLKKHVKRRKRKRNKDGKKIVDSLTNITVDKNKSFKQKNTKMNSSTIDGYLDKIKIALFQILNTCDNGIELGLLEKRLAEELASNFDYISLGFEDFYTFLNENIKKFIEIEVKYVSNKESRYIIHLKNRRFGYFNKNNYTILDKQKEKRKTTTSPNKEINDFLMKILNGQTGEPRGSLTNDNIRRSSHKKFSNISLITLNKLLKDEHNISSFNYLNKFKAANSIVISTEEG